MGRISLCTRAPSECSFFHPEQQDPSLLIWTFNRYFGGHSDLLCGVLAVRDNAWGRKAYSGLWNDRMSLGSVMGNMEAWLCVRSLRTLELRVRQASRSAEEIVKWLDEGMRGGEDAEVIKRCVRKVHHSSLQARQPGNEYLATQMPNGHGPVFALTMHSADMAKTLPSLLEYYHHATSLGGVESLIEWRAMSDETVERELVRFSIGVEDGRDLKEDLRQGLKKLCEKF